MLNYDLFGCQSKKKCTQFLGYHYNIKEDIQFIKNNRSQIKSNVINQYIESLLKD